MQVGVPAEEVQILQTGGHPQTLAAMLSGNLEAGILGSAIALTAEQSGMLRIADAMVNLVQGTGVRFGGYRSPTPIETTRNSLR